jgi:hypothetical protein
MLPVFCSCQSALVGPDHHSAKKVLIFYHEIMNLVEKNVGTPAILDTTLVTETIYKHCLNHSLTINQFSFSSFGMQFQPFYPAEF